MGLSVRLIENLSEVVDPVVEFLSVADSRRGIFDVDHLIVPTAGVKAWLNSELAKRLGTSTGLTDGVVANVQVGYVGGLTRYLAPHRFDDEDAWSIDHVTMLILEYMAGRPEFEHLRKRHGGVFAAARHLADRFDRYQARRPRMIALWDQGVPALAPTTRNQVVEGEWVPETLHDQAWQFEVWQSVRQRIGTPSWPTRIRQLVADVSSGSPAAHIPPRLMVAGLQSLSLSAVELIKALSEVSDVEVLLVHPSPELARVWHEEFKNLEITPGVLHERSSDNDIPEGSDSLVASWLRTSREMQHMLTSQGVAYELHRVRSSATGESTLSRVKTAVSNARTDLPHDSAPDDVSVQVHRCYNITRQVEVVHEALVHAFNDISDLQPHEVVIYSPQIDRIAPILSSVFERPVVDADGKEIMIPLRIADRSLRDVSPDVELLANVLELVTGRFSVEAFLKVASADIVMRHLGISEDQQEMWIRTIDRTKVRWGLDSTERRAAGLGALEVHAHSWRQAIERALLGATLPDSVPGIELGGIVPLNDVGTNEIDDLLGLLRVFDVIEELDRVTHDDEGRSKGATAPVSFWCTALERAMKSLCGDEAMLEDALRELRVVHRSTRIPHVGDDSEEIATGVCFADFARVVLDRLGGSASHPPLRSGAVTATSFVPLRGVPFRVVCIVGMDDGVIGATEMESDDILSLQQLIGDDDARIDGRRQLLDAVLGANDRVIITCNGRSITNNAIVPLTTALSEFVDFCVRLGVTRNDDTTSIEYIHPRHHNSPRNFVMGGIMPHRTWSHDRVSLQSALQAGRSRQPIREPRATMSNETPHTVDIDDLARFQNDPLQEFTRNTMGINSFIESQESTPAVLPLVVESDDFAGIVMNLLAGSTSNDFGLDEYLSSVRDSGTVPVGVYGDATIVEARQLVRSILDETAKNSIPPGIPSPQRITCPLSNGIHVVGNITGHHEAEQIISLVRISPKYKRDVEMLAMQLVLLASIDSPTRRGYTVHMHSETPGRAQVRKPKLGADLDVEEAQRRLIVLEELRREALVAPYPRFKDTVKTLFSDAGSPDYDKARKKFNEFVNSSSYMNSREAMVYGRDPQFDDIFRPDGEVMNFWRRLNDVAPYGAGGISRKYEVQ